MASTAREDSLYRRGSPCQSTFAGYIALPLSGTREVRLPKGQRDRRCGRSFPPPNPAIELAGPGEAPMKIRPLQDRILIKRIDEEETTKGGIIIPDTAKEKPSEGKVIAVGKGKLSDDGKVHPLDVKKGDRVLFSKYAGTEVQVEGDEHIIIREDDVLGVVE